MNMKNELIIKSANGKVNQIYFIQPCPNPKTGQLPPCVKTVNGHGDMILSDEEITKMSRGEAHYIPADAIFEIVDGTKFDLDDVVESAKWEAIKYCSWIAKDRFERDGNNELIIDGGVKRYGTADLYVERPGEIIKHKMSKKQLVFNACKYIYEDSETERLKKCRVLGRNLSKAIPADVLDYLIDMAEKKPKTVINLYEGEDWKMQLFLLDAVDRGVVRKSDGIYKYDDKLLGASTEAVMATLRDIRFKKILDTIKRETYPELVQTQKAYDEELLLSVANIVDETTSNDEIPSDDETKVTKKSPYKQK